MIDNGCVLIARKVLDSEIFIGKPSVWLKLWVYLISKVNYGETTSFPRGTNFFKYETVCESFSDGRGEQELTPDIYKKAISFFKKSQMISTSRMPRGLKISILNYDLYQNLENYKAQQSAQQRHNKSTSIQEEDNKEKNTYCVEIQTFFKEKVGRSGGKIDEKALSYWLGFYSLEEIHTAIERIPSDEFWSDKMNLQILFRRKDKSGESVDWINRLITNQPKQKGLSYDAGTW